MPKKNIISFIAILASIFVFSFSPIYLNAQIHFDTDLKNMHLWRGIQVADGVVITSDINYTEKNFKFGFWGGTNTDGNYKEFNYYASFSKSGFMVKLCDTYNFSDDATYNNTEFFNYKAHETGRFLDAIVSYRFQHKFPLLLSWSTIVFGRDRNAFNTSNKYTSYAYAEYPIYNKDNWKVDLGLGGAFALNKGGDSSHFYAKHPGIIDANIKLSRDLVIGDYTIPLSVLCMWNPEENRAFFQVALTIISL